MVRKRLETTAMLIEFRAENHRSIRDEQVLTMEAGGIGVGEDATPRKVAGYSKELLPVAALYGANASGKSNMLNALTAMKDAVAYSHLFSWPGTRMLRTPFAWGQRRNEPSMFEVEAIIESVRYQYGFRLDDEVILEEWLYAWPKDKKQIWFERDGKRFKYGNHLTGENKIIEGVTRANALFLSFAAQLNHAQLTPIYSWVRSIETITPLHHRPYSVFEEGSSPLLMRANRALDPEQRTLLDNNEISDSSFSRVKSLLKHADVGIIDVRKIKKKRFEGGALSDRWEFRHRSELEDAWLPLDQESRGTQTLFQLALPILWAIELGSLMVVDELESSMHPNLAEHIIRLFNDPESNPRNAQLLFSTHDTNLLGTLSGKPPLRRDQVWLTEKDATGATVLYPLTDFKPRKDENIERGYVQGRYGAVPYLGDFRIPEGS